MPSLERLRELQSLDRFCQPGRADCVLGGQFGSEGKGAAVAWLAASLPDTGRHYDIVTCNAGSQAGHTSIHNDEVRVTRHLPTAPLIAPGSMVYLNAGCIIDPGVLMQELEEYNYLGYCLSFSIHPNAAVITPDCISAENREDSAQTKIASTRKGVGEALARKILRSGMIARDHPYLKHYVQEINLNRMARAGNSILVEVPQGYGLSVNSRFYPYCTSRDCTVMQALSDAHLHPDFLGRTMLVLRTYPIRVGGTSGDCYIDQQETSWEAIGREPEITTVTKRVRRVFTWSYLQVLDAITAARPHVVFLTHCDYLNQEQTEKIVNDIVLASQNLMVQPIIWCSIGPSTAEVYLA